MGIPQDEVNYDRNQGGEGEIVEDFVDLNTMKILYSINDPKNCIHFNGCSSSPNLAIISVDIEIKTMSKMSLNYFIYIYLFIRDSISYSDY